jgi:peptidyl-prolyl cis-trans isomerase C
MSAFQLTLRILPMVLSVCLLGCSETNEQSRKLQGKQVLAVVNGVPITATQFENQLRNLATYRVSRHFTEDEKKALLYEMIHAELLLQAAMEHNFPQQNEQVRRTIVNEFLLEEINRTYQPTDDEIVNAYKKHKAELDAICLRHILVSINRHTDQEALNLAKRYRAQLLDGDDFIHMATILSEDPGSAEKGGDLGCINQQTSFVEEFKQAAFALQEVGAISDPIKTQFGYHLIMLVEDRRGLENNRQAVRNQLLNSRRKETFDRMLIKLKEKAKITAHFEKLTDFNLPAVDDTKP